MRTRRHGTGRAGVRGVVRAVGLPVLLAGLASCAPPPDAELVPRSTLIIGVDVSESFQRDNRYRDALEFAGHYIRGHLQGLGELEQPRALFVGAIGGERPGQPQAFHPIHDFEGKSATQITTDLRQWFPPNDQYTDFTAFFQRAATLVKRQNLVLAPVTLVLFTDGVPDVGVSGSSINEPARYANIDLDELEYLARNVTVRVLYPDPTVAVQWEQSVPRDRVRMWTVDAVVMRGWREQLRQPDAPAAVAASREAAEGMDAAANGDPTAGRETSRPAQAAILSPPREGDEQPDLWRWIRDNVDFRVRRSVL